MKIWDTNAVTYVARTARGGRTAGRHKRSNGTNAIHPSGPQSSGGKLAHRHRPDSPVAIQTRREEAGAFVVRAARIIECTDGSAEEGELGIERGRVRDVVCKV
jgi:hypothetical protein